MAIPVADVQVLVFGEPKSSDDINQMWVFGEPYGILGGTDVAELENKSANMGPKMIAEKLI